ncbi:hypothetical protein ACO2Q0_21460 [Phenylobacterium sp. VNQ135]|uniref:hypothetical protein n=1 Tax=Phenylobacterium sp. VNQ135 TaxID=3400922 RepID=UPI003BFFD64B
MLSHGLMGKPDGVAALAETFARGGYVVVAPAHADSPERGGAAPGEIGIPSQPCAEFFAQVIWKA